MLGELYPYQGNQLLFSVWTGLVCTLFKDYHTINVYTSEEAENDVMMDIVLQIAENQCNLQVFLNKVSARLKTYPLNRTGQKYIIYAQELVDGWNVLERIWQRFHNRDGDELFLILIPKNEVNSESLQFVHKAWKQLYYFSVLVADITLVQDPSSSVHLNVLIANPYNVINNTSGSMAFRNFRFTEDSTRADWIHMTSHLKSRVKYLNGYPIKIAMHAYILLSEPVFDKEGKLTRFMGYEGIVVNEYARIFNFTPIYNLPRDGIVYGGQMENGSFTGAVKDVEEGIADIFGNRKKFSVNDLRHSQYLKSTQQTDLVVVVPKSLPRLKIIGTLFSVLDGTVSKISILSIVLIVMAWTVVKVNNEMVRSRKYLKHYSHREKFNALVVVVMESICVMSNTSFRVPTCSKERIFYAGLSIWALAVTNIYIGTITTRLAVTKNSEIDTVEQLIQSGLKIECLKDTYIKVMTEPSKENTKQQLTKHQLLSKQLVLIYNPAGLLERIAFDRDTAALSTRYIADAMLESSLALYGTELIRVMKEPVSEIFHSLVMREGWPLLQPLEKAETSLLEGGVLDHWQMSNKYEFDLKKNRSSLHGSEHSSLTLDNFRFTFLLWGLFLMISVLVFILELICQRSRFD